MSSSAVLFDLVELLGFLLAPLDFAGWSMLIEQKLDASQRRFMEILTDVKYFFMEYEVEGKTWTFRWNSVLGFIVLGGLISLCAYLVFVRSVATFFPDMGWPAFEPTLGTEGYTDVAIYVAVALPGIVILGVPLLCVMISLLLGGLGLIMGLMNRAPSGIIGSIGLLIALISFGAKFFTFAS